MCFGRVESVLFSDHGKRIVFEVVEEGDGGVAVADFWFGRRAGAPSAGGEHAAGGGWGGKLTGVKSGVPKLKGPAGCCWVRDVG